MPNRFQPIPNGTSPEQMIAMINRNFAELDNEGVNKIFYGSDGKPSVWINGSQSVIKVAPTGIDVTTASDDQLNFNSSQSVFKIVASGIRTLTKPANEDFVSVDIPHSLGYAPLMVAFVEISGTIYQTPHNSIQDTGGAGFTVNEQDGAQVSSTDVTLYIDVPDASTKFSTEITRTFKYYILQESAS